MSPSVSSCLIKIQFNLYLNKNNEIFKIFGIKFTSDFTVESANGLKFVSPHAIRKAPNLTVCS